MGKKESLDIFIQEAENSGLIVNDPIADGKLHRVPTITKPYSKNGAYVLHLDDMPACMIANWEIMESPKTMSLSQNYNDFTQKEKKEFKEKVDRRKKKVKADLKKQQGIAQDEAQKLFDTLKPIYKEHPYLLKKQIPIVDSMLKRGRNIFIPLVDKNYKITAFQEIWETGKKQNQKHGNFIGSFFPIGEPSQTIYICEGVATGVSIYQATKSQVLAALNSSNIENVAIIAKENFPDSKIIIAADHDAVKYINGKEIKILSKLREKAKGLSLDICYPDKIGYDFNDVYVNEGREAVVDQCNNFKEVKENPEMKETKQPYNVLSFDDIYKEKGEFEPIINGLFNEGDNVVIHATGGVGKSLFSTYLALFLSARDSLISDNSWPKLFDTFPVSKERCTLFIQSENSQIALYQRVQKMCNGDERLINGLKNVFIPKVNDDVCLFGKSFNDDIFVEWLEGLISFIEDQNNKKIDIIIIDPFISFHNCEENNNGELRDVLDKITKLAKKMGVTPILIHHDNKDGGFRGASALHDWSRSRIQLSHNKDTNDIKVTHEKSNNGPLFKPFHLRFNDNLIFRLN